MMELARKMNGLTADQLCDLMRGTIEGEPYDTCECCKHVGCSIYEEPCSKCKNNYTSLFEQRTLRDSINDMGDYELARLFHSVMEASSGQV